MKCGIKHLRLLLEVEGATDVGLLASILVDGDLAVNGTNVGTDGNLPLLFGGRGR